MFITLEGGEGAGKSTQVLLLAEALARAGFPALRTREPGGAPGAEALRAMLLGGGIEWSAEGETHLHFAARAEHLARTIGPALAAGMVVVCDRFADSTMAYQGFGLGADRELIAGLTRLLPVRPTLTLVLRVSPAVAQARMQARRQAADRYEVLDQGFHARVAAGFLDIAAQDPGRCRVLDADDSIEAVHRQVRAAVGQRLSGFA